MMSAWSIKVWLGIILLLLLSGCNSLGEHYRLEAGQSLPANRHVVALEARLEAGSTVEGNLSLTASEVYFNTHVYGDATIVASELSIGPQAVIDGDLTYCIVRGGSFQQHENALIWGDSLNSCDPNAEARVLEARRGSATQTLLLRVGGISLASLFGGLLAALVTIIRPQQVRRVTLVAQEHQLLSLGLGGLTLLTAMGLSLLYMLSLLLVVPVVLGPLVLGAWVLLLLLMLFGGAALSQPLGHHLLRLLRVREPLPVLSATVGAGLLTFFILVFSVIDRLWSLSLLFGGLMAIWGLGAVLLTRAGTRRYPSHRNNQLS